MTIADTLPMIERRRIEATMLKHVYETLKESHGTEVAKRVIGDAVRRSSIEQASQLAASEPSGQTSMRTFIDRQAQWRMGDALITETLHESDTHFDFNVTRCRYAEMYREMGLGEIGPLLSCQRDGTFCEGYDPRLKMERTQTIMQGASHCDFRYHWVEAEGESESRD
jgi:hypothetical protein